MGFFKSVCGVCNGEAGMTRLKLKKSKAWICSECLKKAGGIMVVDVGKATVEDVQAILQEKADRIGDDPMSTAEGMYNYCKEHNFGKGFNEKQSLKHFTVLQDNLLKGEKVLMTYIGLNDFQSATKHDNNYAYAITSKRIIYGQKKVAGANFKAVEHGKINDITFETGVLFGTLKIDTPYEKIKVGLDKGSATHINNKIHEVLSELKGELVPVKETQQQVAAALSPADEIKKYKELLDMDAITQEEFDLKKKELLGL
ncbi:PH domain-containing protein [Priestia megaterium]|uniref:PH domain-containing protein n=1 Tax=Priestia megaterium TaxID=1404 RepID=UPI0035D7E551